MLPKKVGSHYAGDRSTIITQARMYTVCHITVVVCILQWQYYLFLNGRTVAQIGSYQCSMQIYILVYRKVKVC